MSSTHELLMLRHVKHRSMVILKIFHDSQLISEQIKEITVYFMMVFSTDGDDDGDASDADAAMMIPQ